MLYKFIVLGIIPGTHEQLNFYSFLLFVSVLCAVFAVISEGRNRFKFRYANRKFYELISL